MKYRVQIQVCALISMEVEADDDKQADQKAYEIHDALTETDIGTRYAIDEIYDSNLTNVVPVEEPPPVQLPEDVQRWVDAQIRYSTKQVRIVGANDRGHGWEILIRYETADGPRQSMLWMQKELANE